MRKLGFWSKVVPCGLAALLGMAAPQVSAEPEPNSGTIESAGDALQFGVPLVALGLTFLFDKGCDGDDCDSGLFSSDPAGTPLAFAGLSLNGSPRHDLAVAMARTQLVTYGLKYSVDAPRPNGSGQSFPSGHTAAAFTGAEFIRKQYGWGWGAPAYLTAAFVGWSRVVSGNHWTQDVLAGAAIGILSNYDLAQFQLPFGNITLGPALVSPGRYPASFDASADVPDLAPDSRGWAPPAVAPGIHFELRF